LGRCRARAWLLGLASLVAACGSAPQVTRVDFTKTAGVYVVVYSARADVRQPMEDQLVADLVARSMIGFASHVDLADVVTRTPADVIRAAEQHRAAAILVVNQVTPEATEPVVKDPARISPEHADLEAFFAHARSVLPAPVDPATELIAEANLFLLQVPQQQERSAAEAPLFWSGAAWTTAADGRGGGLRDLSTQIAEALGRAQRQLRGD